MLKICISAHLHSLSLQKANQTANSTYNVYLFCQLFIMITKLFYIKKIRNPRHLYECGSPAQSPRAKTIDQQVIYFNISMGHLF